MLLVLSVKSSVVVSVKLFVVVPLVVLSIVPLLVTLSAGFASVALYADFVVEVVVFGVSVAVPAVVTVPAFVVVRVPVLVFVAVFSVSSVSAPLCVISRRAVPNGLNFAVTSNIAVKNGFCVSITFCPRAVSSSVCTARRSAR